MQKVSLRIWNQCWQIFRRDEDESLKLKVLLSEEKFLKQADIDQANQLYVLVGFETSIRIGATSLRVKDLFTYQQNKVSVTCTYQTLLDYFQNQITAEEEAIQDAEVYLKKNNEAFYGQTIE